MACVAVIASWLTSSARVGACLCIGAIASTACGVVGAASISAHYSLRAAIFDGGTLAVPTIVALHALSRVAHSVGPSVATSRRERPAG